MSSLIVKGRSSQLFPFDHKVHARISASLRPSGEIGRHSGLKIRRLPERGRTGSIPVSGTKSLCHKIRV
jgi:hypothetical protein